MRVASASKALTLMAVGSNSDSFDGKDCCPEYESLLKFERN